MNVFEIFAKLSLDSSEYEKGLDSSEKDAQSFGSKLKNGLVTAGKVGAGAIAAVGSAAAAAGAVMVKQAGAVAEHGDQIDKMSQKLGLSSEAYQQWDYVLGQSGADINSMSTGMKTLTNKLDEAKNGGEDAQKMFAKLGISMDDINKMSREELFEASIKGFQGMADSTERAALANDLFGKSGQELTPLFNTSIEETEALLQASKDLGFVMSEESVKAAADYQDALDTMQRTIGGVKTSIVGDFLPGITMVMDGLTQIFAGGEGGESVLAEGISNILTSLQEAIPKVIEVGGKIVSALFNALMDNIPQVAKGGTEILISVVSAIVSAIPKLIPAAITMIKTIVQTLVENFPKIVETGKKAVAELAGGMDPADLIKKGGELLQKLINKIFEYMPALMQKGVDFVSNMASGVAKNLPSILSAITSVLSNVLTTILQRMPEFLAQGVEMLGKLAQGIGQNIPTILTSIGQALAQLLATIGSNLPQFLQQGIELLGKLATGIVQAIPDLISQIPTIFNRFTEAFDGYDWGSIGWNLIMGVIDGISNAAGWLYDAVIGAVSNAWDGMLRWLGIASPSKKAEKIIGKNWALGIGVGFEKEMPVDDMVNSVEGAFDEINDLSPSIETSYGGGTVSNTSNSLAPVFNIYGAENQDAKEIAYEVQRILTQWERQRQTAFA